MPRTGDLRKFDAEIDLMQHAAIDIHHCGFIRGQARAFGQCSDVYLERMHSRLDGGKVIHAVLIGGYDRSVFGDNPYVSDRLITFILNTVFIPVVEHLSNYRSQIEERIGDHRAGTSQLDELSREADRDRIALQRGLEVLRRNVRIVRERRGSDPVPN